MTIPAQYRTQLDLSALESLLSNPKAIRRALAQATNNTHKSLQHALGRNTCLLGESVKTAKEDRTQIHTKVLYLAPHNMSGVNICPSAKTCVKDCLNTAGKGTLDSVQLARVNKTKQLLGNPQLFAALILKETLRHVAKCKDLGVIPAIRLNGTSDIKWSKLWDCMTLLGAQCYEYTKRLDIVSEAEQNRVHITYSYQGARDQTKADLIALSEFTGTNIAVVFALKPSQALPESWLGIPVIDGDTTDNRFLDQPFHVVGLRAKGKARKSKNKAFIVHV